MIKRLVDLVLSVFGLVVFSPLFLLVAVAIKFYDEGPIFFTQVRAGRGGRNFRIKKFRTMRVRHESGPSLTVGQDRRITPVGGILRRYKLDELPQLWNVFCGEMTFVGPRPEVPEYVVLYTEKQRAVLQLKPGITDPASFAFFDESALLSQVADPERFYREQLMVEKIRINLEYAAKAGLTTDLLLILATVGRTAGLRFDLFGWLSIAPPQIKLGER